MLFSLKNDNLGTKIKVLKFVGIQPKYNPKFLIFGPEIPGLNHFRIFYESPVFHFSPKWAKI